MEKIISLENVALAFDGEPILNNINLDIFDKEFVTLLGPSGCGKTTVSKILSENGVDVIDCDLVAKKIVEPGMPAKKYFNAMCDSFNADAKALHDEIVALAQAE